MSAPKPINQAVNMIHDAKHAVGGPYKNGSACQMLAMLLEHDLPKDGEPMTIDGIKLGGEILPWENVRAMIQRVKRKMGIQVKTRVQDGKLVVWRVLG